MDRATDADHQVDVDGVATRPLRQRALIVAQIVKIVGETIGAIQIEASLIMEDHTAPMLLAPHDVRVGKVEPLRLIVLREERLCFQFLGTVGGAGRGC